jgi:hypothetical protein
MMCVWNHLQLCGGEMELTEGPMRHVHAWRPYGGGGVLFWWYCSGCAGPCGCRFALCMFHVCSSHLHHVCTSLYASTVIAAKCSCVTPRP